MGTVAILMGEVAIQRGKAAIRMATAAIPGCDPLPWKGGSPISGCDPPIRIAVLPIWVGMTPAQ